jgi:hypothetical protein
MTHGFEVLCGPTVLPAIGPVKVSGIAVAAPGNARVIAIARTAAKLIFLVSLLILSPP